MGTGAKRYEELEAWQIADELRREVLALTEKGPASKDFKWRDQIRDAASSAVRNIPEGFGRFRPADFARFMEYLTRFHNGDSRPGHRGHSARILHS